MDEKMKKIRSEARKIEPIMRIGKNGITENVVNEIVKLLKKREYIKIKFLHSFIGMEDRKEAGKELAEKSNSDIVEQVGGVVVLMRKRK